MNKNVTILIIVLTIILIAGYLVWLRGKFQTSPVLITPIPTPMVTIEPTEIPTPTVEASPTATPTPTKSEPTATVTPRVRKVSPTPTPKVSGSITRPRTPTPTKSVVSE